MSCILFKKHAGIDATSNKDAGIDHACRDGRSLVPRRCIFFNKHTNIHSLHHHNLARMLPCVHQVTIWDVVNVPLAVWSAAEILESPKFPCPLYLHGRRGQHVRISGAQFSQPPVPFLRRQLHLHKVLSTNLQSVEYEYGHTPCTTVGGRRGHFSCASGSVQHNLHPCCSECAAGQNANTTKAHQNANTLHTCASSVVPTGQLAPSEPSDEAW